MFANRRTFEVLSIPLKVHLYISHIIRCLLFVLFTTVFSMVVRINKDFSIATYRSYAVKYFYD